MEKVIETYKLGDISVTVSETTNPQKVRILAESDGKTFDITARLYEYQHYNRLMNQKIRRFFREQSPT